MNALRKISLGVAIMAAGCLRAELPPPNAGGTISVEVSVGGDARAAQYDYQPPKPYTILAQTVRRSINAVSKPVFVPGAAGSVVSVFTFDDAYSANHPEIPKPIRGAGPHFESTVYYRSATARTDWDAQGRPTFSLRGRTGRTGSLLAIEGRGRGQLFQNQGGPSNYPVPRFLVDDVVKTEGKVPWFNLGQLVIGGLSYRLDYRYLTGAGNFWTETQPDGTVAVFHSAFYRLVGDELGEFYPIGSVTTTGTPGQPPHFETQTEPLTPEAALQKLKETDWSFTGEFAPVSPAVAIYAAAASGATASKLRYKLQVQPGLARTIIWSETFTPEGATEPTDYRFVSEEVAATASETQVHLLDPFQWLEGRSGRYEVVAFESESFDATLTADTNRDGALVSAGGPITPYVIAHADTVSTEQPFLIAVNADDDDADGVLDRADAVVNGADDPADFVPVFLNIKQLLATLPPSASARYKLKQADGALNFVYTDLAQSTAFTYLNNPGGGFGPAFDQPASVASVDTITPDGVELSADFLNRIRTQGQGVILVEATRPTQQPLILSVETATGTAIVRLPLLAYEATLAVDANRDGMIRATREDASDLTSSDRPLRFWLNDDDDSGDVNGSDIPGDGSNDFGTGIAGPPGLGSDFGVDGNRDLIDWFPVFLDLKQLLTVLPPSASVKYKLKHEGNVLSFAYTDLTRERAFAYQKERLVTGFGFNFDRAPGEAQATQITATGAVLSDEFLTRIKDQNAGVILVEAGATTDKPLVLVVEKDGTTIAEMKLELKVGPVEDMYRRLNLRAGGDAPSSGLSGLRQDDGLPTSMGEPSNFPDAAGADSWLIFVHGYNVSGAAARGWNSEAFKRFYWSHNKARFVGVSWFGNPYGAEDDKVADYHLAVMNAFVSAPALAAKINPLTGRKTIVGHSLGCGIVSSAIHDAGLVVNDFCMVDAAMSMEAYKSDMTADVEGMALPPWVDGEGSSTPNYPRGAWASEWHRLFENTPADQRNGVTWRGRLSGVVSVAHNFYSRTEDVLARLPGTPPGTTVSILIFQPGMLFGRYAWTVQEKTKGNRLDLFPLWGIFGHVRAGSDYGGWGFNLTDPADPIDPVYYWADSSVLGGCKRAPLSLLPDPSTSLGHELYKRAPLFDPGYGSETGCSRRYDPTQNLRGPDWLPNLFNDATGSATAGDPAKRNQLLAQAFPALTQPAGANHTPAFSAARNYNMPEELVSAAGWPSARGQEIVGGTPMARWLHSDLREVAYLYTHLLFDQIVTISEGTP